MSDPISGKTTRLHEIEWRVAQRMDGSRDIDWLHEYARGSYPKATREQIEQFVIHLVEVGLLDSAGGANAENDNDFAEATAIDPNQRSWIVADVRSSSMSMLPESEVEVDEANVIPFPKTGGSAHMFDSNTDRMSPLHDPSMDVTPGAEDVEARVATFVDPAMIQPSDVPLDVNPNALAPYVPGGPNAISAEFELMPLGNPENLPVPIPDEVGGLGPAATLPDEPDQELAAEKPPWYARPGIRRLRFPAVALVLVGVSALVPYPRYVTDECVVLPLERAEVRAQVDGILTKILVDEGQHVESGQVVAELDTRDLDAAIQQAKAEVQSLSAKLDKMKHGSRAEEIARAEAAVAGRAKDVQFAKIEAHRKQQLFSQGVGSGEQRDNAQREYQMMLSQLTQAQAELRLMRAGFRPEEIKVAEAELRGAEAQVEYLVRKREHLTIASPIDGQIMTPKFRERLHAKISAGDTVFEVANTAQVRVEILVPEQEVELVRLGQPTVVKVQGLPLHPFSGMVTFIAPAVEKQGERRFVRAVTVIENPEGQLHEGMTGYGEIDTGESTLLRLALRRLVRWVRVRFLI